MAMYSSFVVIHRFLELALVINLAGNVDYIPQEALENLEWYTTFWDDMEKLEKVIKFDESTGEGNTSIPITILPKSPSINRIIFST